LWGLIAAVVCVAAGVFYVEFPFKTILGQWTFIEVNDWNAVKVHWTFCDRYYTRKSVSKLYVSGRA
jgi:hypothetical protein